MPELAATLTIDGDLPEVTVADGDQLVEWYRAVVRANRWHTCPHCGANSDTRWKLVRHIRVHTGERPFRCGVCSKAFTQKAALKTHQTYVHERKRKPRRPVTRSRVKKRGGGVFKTEPCSTGAT